ncbi:hypothetical protein PFICI_11873 [Pestalotiopsis fici W106-1]|uniref:Heterokaryon incompatibility domain-containing protein n=1 Tax=Pestalotiopsis fici (strain W106-1 / CGMCC3.15140) TaxID=1229662 RepID=W3WUE5_PESFW|nr:uncharacterized protein PFICI_11873 [Pestalotiopsis fici W106-1]ETS76486.1 hypothetical protein PFICI_11873 [Pestalotiopsis fici W106-1]
MSQVCSVCYGILEKLFDDETYSDVTWDERGMYRVTKFGVTKPSQNEGAQELVNCLTLFESCNLCRLFKASGMPGRWTHDDAKNFEPHIRIAPDAQLPGNKGIGLISLGGYSGAGIHLVADASSQAYGRGDVSGTFLHNTGTPESFVKCREWFTRCQKQHSQCEYTMAGDMIGLEHPLPTRILEIDTENDCLRLVETRGTMGRWAALSYCWGGDVPLKTTRENLGQRLAGIQMSDLPKTFFDAVKVTRELGLHHIWIDSLCILQGDVQDWKSEAGKMGAVYEFAEIVLVAAAAENSVAGLFMDVNTDEYREPDTEEYREPELTWAELPYIKGGVEAGSIWGVANAHRSTSMELFAPLKTRAWTIQERCLARRSIYFAKDGIWWCCRQYESTCWRHDAKSFVDHQVQWRETGDWSLLLKHFQSGRLTVLTDNLPALEGIASRAAANRGDKYYHGCWTGDMPDQLLWCGPVERPAELADRPTWSWASTYGRRRFYIYDESGAEEPRGVYCQSFDPGTDGELKVRLCPILTNIDAIQTPLDDDTLRRNLHLHIGINHVAAFLCSSLTNMLMIKVDGQIVGGAVVDDMVWYLNQVKTGNALAGCVLLRAEKYGQDDSSCDSPNRYFGLLLVRKSGDPDTYSRAGLMMLHSTSCVEKAIRKDFVLI